MKKYLLYAIGEIILVVIGILIALQINNWNNNELSNQRDVKLLEKLIKEADYNIHRATFLDVEVMTEMADFDDTLLTILERGVEEKDLKIFIENPIYYFNDFNLNRSIYEQMKNTGTLFSIGSDSLITQIQTYYKLCERETLYNATYARGILRRKEKCYGGFFDLKYLMNIKRPRAIQQHSWIFDPNSSHYMNLIHYVSEAKYNNRLMANKLRGIIQESQQLIEVIKKELKAKE